jgi:hypothetical protein
VFHFQVSQNCKTQILASSCVSVCLYFHLHGTTQLSLYKFSSHLIYGYFSDTLNTITVSNTYCFPQQQWLGEKALASHCKHTLPELLRRASDDNQTSKFETFWAVKKINSYCLFVRGCVTWMIKMEQNGNNFNLNLCLFQD